MLYHASPIPNLTTITPHISNHNIPLIYLSSKPENTLVYLSNAIEKHCRETGYSHNGVYMTWGSYGFTKEGILKLDEYYPNAAIDTYKGVSGYIYEVEKTEKALPFSEIPFAYTSESELEVSSVIFIPDAYEALTKAAAEGKIIMTKYENNSESFLQWIEKIVREEYKNANDHREYQYFLKAKFSFLD